jgi:NTE family protein
MRTQKWKRSRVTRLFTLIVICGLAAGCSTMRPGNAPIDHIDLLSGYRPELHTKSRSTGEIAFALAFSGGGTRAAALAYGVLLELRDTTVTLSGKQVRLLDEVDTISSVSGGSFTAAYYGLYGDRIFEDFEERFLTRNVERDIVLRMLRPWNLVKLIFPFYDRSELAIDYYDKQIFDGARFADLEKSKGPLIQINSTDLSAGGKFTFIQPQFDLLCSDLTPIKIARAVTASSAVPVVFPAIVLRNFAGQCEYEKPDWIDDALARRKASPRRYHLASQAIAYLDQERNQYLHLVDGGIADNLGVRGPLDQVVESGGMWARFDKLGVERPRTTVFIVVDSSTSPKRSFVSVPGAPSLAAMIGSISDTQLHRYNFETKDLLFEKMKDWADDMASHDTPITSHLIDVAEYYIADPAEREFFDSVPTTLQLDDETVQRLIDLGRKLLRESDEFKHLLAELREETPASAGTTQP